MNNVFKSDKRNQSVVYFSDSLSCCLALLMQSSRNHAEQIVMEEQEERRGEEKEGRGEDSSRERSRVQNITKESGEERGGGRGERRGGGREEERIGEQREDVKEDRSEKENIRR